MGKKLPWVIMTTYQDIVADYSPEYCSILEACYRNNMMSEGGGEAIRAMLEGLDLVGKHVLDFGSGLGGACVYIAEHFSPAHVTGIEINEWMVDYSKHHTPMEYQGVVGFRHFVPPSLPLEDHSIDVIFSKGVLVHVQNMLPLFADLYRILKPGGVLVIDDWLSPTENVWSESMNTVCEKKGLTLFAHTEAHYLEVLEKTGFDPVTIKDLNQPYIRYNLDIVKHLKHPNSELLFQAKFGVENYQDAIWSYESIAKAISENELLIRGLRAQKPA